jgi:RNA polymerase sigma factor for flagellar operon FliA
MNPENLEQEEIAYTPPPAQVEQLVEEHMGWATSIAKSVARAWNMDWELDGLDGGAYEGLLFCARRYNPTMGVPFRAYARRRIHEAATEEARKSKTWQRGVGSGTEEEQTAREISATLFDMFPELREGLLPASGVSTEDTMRVSVRQLLTSASLSLIATFRDSAQSNPENALEYKRVLELIATMDTVHQNILFAIYWKGQSMRSLAEEWEIDELAVIREHQEILAYIAKRTESKTATTPLKIRRALKNVSLKLKRSKEDPPFARFLISIGIALILINVHQFSAQTPLSEDLINLKSLVDSNFGGLW